MAESNNNGGIGFLGALSLIFVVAKITGYVSWSWWVVFSPVFFGFGLIFFVLIAAFVYTIIKEAF